MTGDRIDANAVRAIDAEASGLMKEGIRLMAGAAPDAAVSALVCFDRALELRRGLPVDASPLLTYGLAACWLNRADALLRLGDPAQVAEAVRSYDEAIVLLGRLALDADPRYPRRLAIALQNRGLALRALGAGADVVTAALVSAIAVLDDPSAAAVADRPYLAAAVWLNLANARVAEDSDAGAAAASDAAQRAMALMAPHEDTEAAAAEVGLKARHILCQTIARRVLPPAPDGEAPADDIHDATDLVDEGLGLVRRWEQRGVTPFREIAYDLFRFGVLVYGRYQPQFLPEFVRDHMNPAASSQDYVDSPELRQVAEDALRSAG